MGQWYAFRGRQSLVWQHVMNKNSKKIFKKLKNESKRDNKIKIRK